MNIPLIDLVRQHKNIEKEIKVAVDKVFRECQFRLGEEVEKFEKTFARHCGTKYCVGVSSGSDALLFSLQALGVGPQDEVITVPNTFISTVLPIVQLGARPVLVDVDDETYQINPRKLEAAITKRTKVIIPVHLYGFPSPMDKIRKIARKHGLFIIEDACQAHGSKFQGKKCGSFGTLSAFSFYPAKNIGASGEAGAVVTNNKALAEKVRIIRHIGQTEKYKHVMMGYNGHLDTVHAAVLLVKLRHLDKWNRQRRKIAKLYDSLLKDLPISLPPNREGLIGNYHVYVIRSKERDELLEFLKRNGVYCGIHYPIPVHLHKALSNLGYKRGDFPIAERQAKEVLSLPMFPELKEEEIRRVSRLMYQFYKK